MNNKTIIVDISVLIKWLLPDEDDFLANKIKHNFTSKEVTIAIPYLTYYEVSNVLTIAVARKRINQEISKKLYSAFLDLEFTVYATKELFIKSLTRSLEYNISSYDASYIALAEYLQTPVVTSDKKLLNKVKSKFVVDLRDYSV